MMAFWLSRSHNIKIHSFRKKALLLQGLICIGLVLSACQPKSPSQLTEEAAKKTQAPAQVAITTPQITPTSTPPAYLQIDPKDLKGVSIEFLHPWTGAEETLVADLVAEYNRTNVWGIQVNVTAAGSAQMLEDTIQTNLAGDQQPNLVAATTASLISWQEQKDVFADLTPFLEDSQWGMSAAEIAEIPQVFWDQDILKNHRLGLPAQRSAQVLFYNQSWAKELGFASAPSTPEEFKEQACAAAQAVAKTKKPENQGTGGWLVDFDPLTTLSWISAFGDSPVPASDDLAYDFNVPSVQNSFAFVHDLYEHGCAWIGKNATPFNYFTQRQALFYASDLQDIIEQTKSSAPSDQWTVIPFPAESGNKPVFLVNGLSYGIFHSSKEQQLAAWLFARWMLLPKNQAQMISASGALPISSSTVDQLSDFRTHHPQWNAALSYLPNAQSAPNLATWLLIKPVLEDAAWQSLQLNVTTDKIPTILQQLNAISAELIKKGHP
jgi:multiple sugar transport system substrate-binding protein